LGASVKKLIIVNSLKNKHPR